MALKQGIVKIIKPAEGEDLSHMEEISAEVLPDIEDLQEVAKYGGEAWGIAEADAGVTRKDYTPARVFKMKSKLMSDINAVRPDLKDDEVEDLATRTIDEIGRQLPTS